MLRNGFRPAVSYAGLSRRHGGWRLGPGRRPRLAPDAADARPARSPSPTMRCVTSWVSRRIPSRLPGRSATSTRPATSCMPARVALRGPIPRPSTCTAPKASCCCRRRCRGSARRSPAARPMGRARSRPARATWASLAHSHVRTVGGHGAPSLGRPNRPLSPSWWYGAPSGAPIPLDGAQTLVYGALFDGDGNPETGSVATADAPNDTYQGTDRWYELIYLPDDQYWGLVVTDQTVAGGGAAAMRRHPVARAPSSMATRSPGPSPSRSSRHPCRPGA